MRAPSPVEVRKMLNIVESFKLNNIEFVVIPVADDKTELLEKMKSNMEKFEEFVKIDEKLHAAASKFEGDVESVQKTDKGRIAAFIRGDNDEVRIENLDISDPWPDKKTWKRPF